LPLKKRDVGKDDMRAKAILNVLFVLWFGSATAQTNEDVIRALGEVAGEL
jgi:hypothetical protein